MFVCLFVCLMFVCLFDSSVHKAQRRSFTAGGILLACPSIVKVFIFLIKTTALEASESLKPG